MKFLYLVLLGLVTVSANNGDLTLPGGYQDTEVDDKVIAAATAAVFAMAGVTAVSECNLIKLISVEKAKKQVVAGTNYKLTLKLGTKGGDNCRDKVEKVCENIVVFEPLPHACKKENKADCLQLTKQEGITCNAGRDAPAVGANQKGGKLAITVGTM